MKNLMMFDISDDLVLPLFFVASQSHQTNNGLRREAKGSVQRRENFQHIPAGEV